MLGFGQIIEEVGHTVESCAYNCGDNENLKHIFSEGGHLKNIIIVLKTEALIYGGKHHSGKHADKASYDADSTEHAVYSLAGEILLIVTHIGVDAGVVNDGERVDESVEVVEDYQRI